MVLISHDRHFINRLCDRVGIVERGELVVYPGNFDDYRDLWLKDGSEPAGQKTPSPLGGASYETTQAASPYEGKSQTALDRKKAADEERRRRRLRKPLENALTQAEERLSEVTSEAAQVELDLTLHSNYQDPGKAKALSLRLADLGREKTRLEETWERAARELESSSEG